MNFNECVLVGRLTRDPEMRDVNGSNVVMFTVATNRSFTKKNGEKSEKTLFMDCELWGQAAPIINDNAKRGTTILVRGPLEQDTFQGKDGSKKTRFKLRVEFFQFGSGTAGRDNEVSAGARSSDGGDDEIPF